MTVAVASRRSTYVPPRVGVVPDDVDLRAYRKATRDAGLQHFRWELDGAAAIYALNGDRWAFGEICILVARRNGKTTLIRPRIIDGLRRGERILHTAHNRDLPRETFVQIASDAMGLFPKLKPRIRWANGSEKIELGNGGSYRITSDRQGAGRGHGGDTVIVDEIREQETFDLVYALGPTLADSQNPQIIYLSNAGHEASVVLNDLRERQGRDPNLCFLEWSAPPDADRADREAWLGANPALPHMPWMWDYLEAQYRKAEISGNFAGFDTEHLCRSVVSMSTPLVNHQAWDECSTAGLRPRPVRPFMAVSMDPGGQRVSAFLAWQLEDGRVECEPLLEHAGSPINVAALGRRLRMEALSRKVQVVGYSGGTDVALARYLPRAKSIDGREFANASAGFASLVDGRRLRCVVSPTLADDITHTVRKDVAAGIWTAVRASEDRPITSALAAIRATWLASAPPASTPRIG